MTNPYVLIHYFPGSFVVLSVSPDTQLSCILEHSSVMTTSLSEDCDSSVEWILSLICN